MRRRFKFNFELSMITSIMQNIVFAAISPHPPIILPSVGSKKDRTQIRKTIESLEKLGKNLKKANPDSIIISSPHPDWGFNVPLFFLAKDFKGKTETFLVGTESPEYYFDKGKETYTKYDIQNTKQKFALIASGDMSHYLKEEGPYGFDPDGPKFDDALLKALKKKDIETILKLDETYPEAGECGLRSFCFLLGMLETRSINSGQSYRPEILSYEGPFGVGYLVANFELR